MKVKFKIFFSCLVKFIFANCFIVTCAIAMENSNSPSPALSLPTASLGAFSGLGAASPGDYSSVDVNPATMSALKKQYLLFGDTSWQKNMNLISFGVLDNVTTPVATLLRIRESIPNDIESRDRRFTLGLSYQIPKSHLSFGLSGDYEQLALTSLTVANYSNYYNGIGFLYEYLTSSKRPIFFGAGINRIFDAYNPLSYDVGISTTFLDGFYSVSLDAFSTNLSGMQKAVSSLTIVANQFLDFKGSYGFLTKDTKSVWGAGIFFHAPVIQLFYTFASSETDDTTSLRQTAGCALNFVF